MKMTAAKKKCTKCNLSFGNLSAHLRYCKAEPPLVPPRIEQPAPPITIAYSYHVMLGAKITPEAVAQARVVLETVQMQYQKRVDELKASIEMLDGYAKDQAESAQ